MAGFDPFSLDSIVTSQRRSRSPSPLDAYLNGGSGFSTGDSELDRLLATLKRQQETSRLNQQYAAEQAANQEAQAQQQAEAAREINGPESESFFDYILNSLNKPLDAVKNLGQGVVQAFSGDIGEAAKSLGRTVGSITPFSETITSAIGLQDFLGDTLGDDSGVSTGENGNVAFGSDLRARDIAASIGSLLGEKKTNTDANGSIFSEFGESGLQDALTVLFTAGEVVGDPTNFLFGAGAANKALKAGKKIEAALDPLATVKALKKTGLDETVQAAGVNLSRANDTLIGGLLGEDAAKLFRDAKLTALDDLKRTENLTGQFFANAEQLGGVENPIFDALDTAGKQFGHKADQLLPGATFAEQFSKGQRELLGGPYSVLNDLIPDKVQEKVFNALTATNKLFGAGSAIFTDSTIAGRLKRLEGLRESELEKLAKKGLTDGNTDLPAWRQAFKAGADALRKGFLQDADTAAVAEVLTKSPSIRRNIGFASETIFDDKLKAIDAAIKSVPEDDLGKLHANIIKQVEEGGEAGLVGSKYDDIIQDVASNVTEMEEMLKSFQRGNGVWIRELEGQLDYFSRAAWSDEFIQWLQRNPKVAESVKDAQSTAARTARESNFATAEAALRRKVEELAPNALPKDLPLFEGDVVQNLRKQIDDAGDRIFRARIQDELIRTNRIGFDEAGAAKFAEDVSAALVKSFDDGVEAAKGRAIKEPPLTPIAEKEILEVENALGKNRKAIGKDIESYEKLPDWVRAKIERDISAGGQVEFTERMQVALKAINISRKRAMRLAQTSMGLSDDGKAALKAGKSDFIDNQVFDRLGNADLDFRDAQQAAEAAGPMVAKQFDEIRGKAEEVHKARKAVVDEVRKKVRDQNALLTRQMQAMRKLMDNPPSGQVKKRATAEFKRLKAVFQDLNLQARDKLSAADETIARGEDAISSAAKASDSLNSGQIPEIDNADVRAIFDDLTDGLDLEGAIADLGAASQNVDEALKQFRKRFPQKKTKGGKAKGKASGETGDPSVIELNNMLKEEAKLRNEAAKLLEKTQAPSRPKSSGGVKEITGQDIAKSNAKVEAANERITDAVERFIKYNGKETFDDAWDAIPQRAKALWVRKQLKDAGYTPRFTERSGLDVFLEDGGLAAALPRDIESLVNLGMSNVPKAITRDYKRVLNLRDNAGTVLKGVDQVNKVFRGFLLSAPQSVATDVIGNSLTAMTLGGMNPADIKRGIGAYARLAGEESLAVKGAQSLAKGGKPQKVKTIYGVVDEAEIFNELQKRGLFNQINIATQREKEVSTALDDFLSASKPKSKVADAAKTAKKPLEAIGNEAFTFREFQDNGFRMSAAMKTLKEGGTFEDAVAKAREIFFDYGDTTNFEKSTMRRLFMFYAFTKKSMAMLGRTAFEKPIANKMLRLMAGAGVNQGDEDFPDWAKKTLGLHVGTDAAGNPIMVGVNGNLVNSAADKLEGNAVHNLLMSLSPVAKIPLELGMDRDLFTGKPIGFSEENASKRIRGGASDRAPAWMRYLPDFAKKALDFREVVDEEGKTRNYEMDSRLRWVFESALPLGQWSRVGEKATGADARKSVGQDVAGLFGVNSRSIVGGSKEEGDLRHVRKARLALESQVNSLAGRPLSISRSGQLEFNENTAAGRRLEDAITPTMEAARKQLEAQGVAQREIDQMLYQIELREVSRLFPQMGAVSETYSRLWDAERYLEDPEGMDQSRQDRLDRMKERIQKRQMRELLSFLPR